MKVYLNPKELLKLDRMAGYPELTKFQKFCFYAHIYWLNFLEFIKFWR